jgi:hypothetical protein
MKMKLQCYCYIMVLNIPAVVSDDMGLSKLKHHVRPMHPGTQKNNKHLANLILPQLILSMTTQLAWYFCSCYCRGIKHWCAPPDNFFKLIDNHGWIKNTAYIQIFLSWIVLKNYILFVNVAKCGWPLIAILKYSINIVQLNGRSSRIAEMIMNLLALWRYANSNLAKRIWENELKNFRQTKLQSILEERNSSLLQLLLLPWNEKHLFRGVKHGKNVISVNYPWKGFHGTFIARTNIISVEYHGDNPFPRN